MAGRHAKHFGPSLPVSRRCFAAFDGTAEGSADEAKALHSSLETVDDDDFFSLFNDDCDNLPFSSLPSSSLPTSSPSASDALQEDEPADWASSSDSYDPPPPPPPIPVMTRDLSSFLASFEHHSASFSPDEYAVALHHFASEIAPGESPESVASNDEVLAFLRETADALLVSLERGAPPPPCTPPFPFSPHLRP